MGGIRESGRGLRGHVRAPGFVRAAVRKLRARSKDWSPDKDRDYHDSLFGQQDYYPFSFAHPGYITIRRFADLASPFLKGFRTVLDLGCGPGEITCELARRHADITFLGIDHSPAGIERAKHNAASLDLTNASFQVARIEEFVPDGPADLVAMFDAFHHLADPKRFISRMGEVTSRFLLVEPRGDWKGDWQKDLDLDWLLLELDKIGYRLALTTGERPAPEPRTGGTPPPRPGQPLEHRYSLEDFQRLFDGFGIRVRGTVSGIEVYPPDSVNPAPSRVRSWELAYGILAEVDDRLRDRKLDLLAKHWLIYAEKGLAEEAIAVPDRIPGAGDAEEVQGSHDAQYLNYEGPKQAEAGGEFRAKVTVRNRSFRVWSSRRPASPDHLSYHWLDRHGSVVIWDGERTALPRDIGPGEEAEIFLRVKAPPQPGKFLLTVELLQEGRSWASDTGVPWLTVSFRIRKG